MSLRPLFRNVWGIPLHTLNSLWEGTDLIRPEMSRKEKILHIVRVYEVGAGCRELRGGELVVLPEDNGGAVVTVHTDEGIQHRYCFSEEVVLAEWTGEIPGDEDKTLALPKSYV